MGITMRNLEVVKATDTITSFRSLIGAFDIFMSWDLNSEQGYYRIQPLVHAKKRMCGINILNNIDNPIDVTPCKLTEKKYNLPLVKFISEMQWNLHMAKLTEEGTSSRLEYDCHTYGITHTSDGIYISIDTELIYNMNTIRKTIEKDGIIYKYCLF